MSSSTIITPITTTTTTNNSSTNGIHNSKTNRTLFKNIKNNIPNSPNNAPIKKNSVGIIGNGPNVNNNNNNNKDRKLNSNDGVNFGKKNILFTPSKNSMVSTTKHSSSSSSSLLAKNEYDIESIKKELKSMDISTGGISPLSSPLRESSPISTIDLESIAATTTTTTKLTDAFVAAATSSSSVKYTIDVLLSFKSANSKRPIQIDIVENHQKEIVVPLSLPTTPYNNNNTTNTNSSQHNTANGQKYPIFSPQISPFKIAYAQSSSTKTNNYITPTKKANSNITTPQSNNRNNHHNSNTKSSTKKQNPIPFSLNTATPNQKNTTTPSSKKSTTTPKSNIKINDVNAAFAAAANSSDTTEQPVAIIDGATPTNESPKKTPLKETDPKRLAARQRQIDIGKMTAGYKNYIALVPKSKRKPTDPKTPNKNQVCSKRSWDGQIKKWRRQLHENYDWTGIPFNEKEVEASNNESTEESSLEKEMNKLEISEENENHNN
ncbi:hypothetical protein ACTFIY_004325 [Dictyostelium cf. discoideum]